MIITVSPSQSSNNKPFGRLRKEFWDLGHKLYRSTEEMFPAAFIHGDIFDDAVLREGDIRYGKQAAREADSTFKLPKPLTSLLPLERAHRLHLHLEPLSPLHRGAAAEHRAQARLAALIYAGSMIFGAHMGRPQKGFRTEASPPKPGYLGSDMFCHSAASWVELWDGEVFEKGSVKVEAELMNPHREDLRKMLEPGAIHYQLLWSVTRL